MDESPQAQPPTIEARAALLLQLRRAGVRDLAIMRAFESAPREFFTPHRFRDLAPRNMALPIGCGQTMPAPAALARRLEALGVLPHHRVLEIGTGSGYSAAILARLAREVVSIERFETLAIEATKRLAALDIANVRVLFADGLSPDPSLGPFDRIVLHMSFRDPPQSVLDLLAPEGAAIFGRASPPDKDEGRATESLRLLRREKDSIWTETDLGPCRLGAALTGSASAL
jgi:protein-L-isoaspartate(D-aspartate) O-methyltransferase